MAKPLDALPELPEVTETTRVEEVSGANAQIWNIFSYVVCVVSCIVSMACAHDVTCAYCIGYGARV